MNQLKLSLARRTIRAPQGRKRRALFASVFSLHNATRKGREETVPITVKASHELAQTLVNELKKGVAFVGGTACLLQESRNEPRNLFDLGRKFHRHHPAKIHRGESQLIS